MKHVLLIVILSFVVLQACKKDEPDPDPVPQESVLDYFPLTVGNYWIYEVSHCDSTWTECNYSRTDSNYVSKDTMIRGNMYYKIEGRNFLFPEPFFLRDSLDYLVDHKGNILFSNKDFKTKFSEEYVVVGDNDTLYHWYNKMDETPFHVDVPAGEFTCLDKKLSFFRKQENFETEFNSHYALSKNTGPVYSNAMFASSTGGIKWELLRYSIQPPMMP